MSADRSILVTGDFLIDHHIYEGQRHHFGDQDRPGVCVKEELGGAALVHLLVQELAAGRVPSVKSVLAIDAAAALAASRVPSASCSCTDKPFGAYAFWRPYGTDQEQFWRVSHAMGFGGEAVKPGAWPWTEAPGLPRTPDVLVIADGGMGFRARMNGDRWRIPIKDKKFSNSLKAEKKTPREQGVKAVVPGEPGWIVLKTSAPIAQGDLWRELVLNHSDHLITIISAAELRRAGVRLGQGLSWEQNLEELQREMRSNTALIALKKSRHLIVSFGVEAVMLLTRENGSHTAHFTFDPASVEDEQRKAAEGDVYGVLSCLAATVALAAAQAPSAPDLPQGVRQGMVAMRQLMMTGHGSAKLPGAGFPAKTLADTLSKAPDGVKYEIRQFDCRPTTSPVKPGWSLAAVPQPPGAIGARTPLFGMAHRVLSKGLTELHAPTLRIGGFVTADRGEIEALRSLKSLIDRYLADKKAKKPLSIGVFGPPGAGKSFAVEELANGTKLKWRVFNLSQFKDSEDLIGALHQVRDDVLTGKTPMVFFDEFDSQKFIWLKYLLAPMQDGCFQEKQVSHPVGKCIFLFAGGTSSTYEDFKARGGDMSKPPKPGDQMEFRLAKGPDFASRLDGVLNVVGPNPRVFGSATKDVDIFYPVRRAVFIRANLGCGSDERLVVDPALATALLELSEYKNGSRSLTKMLDPFKAARKQGTSSVDRDMRLSCLLPADQLSLYVDKKEFDGLLVRDVECVLALGVDKLASAVHSFYRKLGKKEGWLEKQHDCTLAQLSAFFQESNRAAARRIPRVLALVGLQVVAGRFTKKEENEIRRIISFHAETLGEAEHDLWVDWHRANGWRQSTETPPKRVDARQVHKLMIPFRDLTLDQKQKDLNAVCAYVDIVKLAGMKIVPRV